MILIRKIFDLDDFKAIKQLLLEDGYFYNRKKKRYFSAILKEKSDFLVPKY